MKTLIRKLLREGLSEAEHVDDGHSIDRIKQRIDVFSDEDLPFEAKERIFHNLDIVEKTDFPLKKSFAIMLGSFKPNPESIHFTTQGYGNTGTNMNGYYVIDNDDGTLKKSIGDEFWLIVRGNVIHTVFLRQSIQTKDLSKNSEELKVDYSFKDITNDLKARQPKQKKKEPIVVIDGVKWVVDATKELMYKKNKPTKRYNIDNLIDKLDPVAQEQILDLL